MEKLPEILARCLPIPWLVGAADDDVQAGPTSLAKIVAPPPEERVQLFELDAHGQLRSLEGVRSQRADVFMLGIALCANWLCVCRYCLLKRGSFS